MQWLSTKDISCEFQSNKLLRWRCAVQCFAVEVVGSAAFAYELQKDSMSLLLTREGTELSRYNRFKSLVSLLKHGEVGPPRGKRQTDCPKLLLCLHTTDTVYRDIVRFVISQYAHNLYLYSPPQWQIQDFQDGRGRHP